MVNSGISTQIPNPTTEDCKTVSQCMHVLSSLMHKLQSLNIKKPTADDITDKTDELQKALMLAKISASLTLAA